MLTAETIRKLLAALNDELAATGVVGEVGLCGGAVMCLVFNAREATRDVDAVFAPTGAIRGAAAKVAKALDVPEDWLSDAAKAFFLVDPPKQQVLDLSNLRVWAPTAGYMLAMKCVSARFDSHDKNDVAFLIDFLKLTDPPDVFRIIQQYYPDQVVPAKTKFLVEELLSR